MENDVPEDEVIPQEERVPEPVEEAQAPPKVFLIAQPTISKGGSFPKLEPLAEYGEIHVLITESASYRPNRTLNDVLRQMKELFRPHVDYLVWAGGDTMGAFIAGIVCERLGYDSINWLRFDRPVVDGRRSDERARYVPIKFTMYRPPHEAGA